ncbi:MAG: division/cell wall cluster transcriptional repressor MraZ [Clostridiales bacterium]|nr:division/cell wall cluster transcriptional repressor MraZ [Clostridiales bacterium]
MLINSFEHTVDAKGRLFIPAKWREDLGNTVIVTRGMLGKDEGRCLFGMSLDVWNGLLERYNKIAMTDVKAQNALRMIFANACDCELDKQGRILIGNTLRKYAGIDKDAVLVGMGNRIEIWSQEAWENKLEQNETETDESEALSYLAGLGI